MSDADCVELRWHVHDAPEWVARAICDTRATDRRFARPPLQWPGEMYKWAGPSSESFFASAFPQP